MPTRLSFHGLVLPAAFVLTSATAIAETTFYGEIDQFEAPGNISQMVYADQYGKLIVRNSGSAIRVIDVSTGTTSTPFLAYWNFRDIDLTPDGRYLYAADYGGENIGYGTPASIHRVHRLDLATNTWETKLTPGIAGRIEAVSEDRFILSSRDQWVTFTYNGWGTTNVAPILNASSTSWLGYYASVYSGDIEYADQTGRLIHGDSGSSSQEISAFRLNGNDFVRQEDSGIYGSAQGYGGTMVLSQDQEAFYYGRLKVEALDVTHNLQVFPEPIYAATNAVAFGQTFYYDAETGLPTDSLGFQTNVFALGANGPELWAYNATSGTLHLFAPVPEPETYALMLAGLVLMATLRPRSRRNVLVVRV